MRPRTDRQTHRRAWSQYISRPLRLTRNVTRRRASTSTGCHFAFALCCHSNETRAPFANPPNSALLGSTPCHSPKWHLGPCSSVIMRWGTDIRTDRHTHAHTHTHDIRPGNGEGLFWFRRFINLSLSYLLRHLPSYLQPRTDPHGATVTCCEVGWPVVVINCRRSNIVADAAVSLHQRAVAMADDCCRQTHKFSPYDITVDAVYILVENRQCHLPHLYLTRLLDVEIGISPKYLMWKTLDRPHRLWCRTSSSTNLSLHRLPSSLRTDSTDFTIGPFLLSISVLCF